VWNIVIDYEKVALCGFILFPPKVMDPLAFYNVGNFYEVMLVYNIAVFLKLIRPVYVDKLIAPEKSIAFKHWTGVPRVQFYPSAFFTAINAPLTEYSGFT
jgi:hypothetical protein